MPRTLIHNSTFNRQIRLSHSLSLSAKTTHHLFNPLLLCFVSGVHIQFRNFSLLMELLEKTMFPLQIRLSSFSSRFPFRKPGMLNLHQDIEACEYQDVQIMWEMLKRAETEMGQSPSRPKNKPIWNNIFRWIRISPCSSSSRQTTTST